jgi:hypothetical protein
MDAVRPAPSDEALPADEEGVVTVRSIVRLSLVWTVAAAAFLLPTAHAQEPGDAAVTPLPIVSHYVDADGGGTLTLEEGMQIMIYPLPPGQPIQVTLLQRGVLYRGAGRLYDPDALGRSPVSFTLYTPAGRAYNFEGMMTASGYGQGTYSPAGFPQRRFPWRTYAVP